MDQYYQLVQEFDGAEWTRDHVIKRALEYAWANRKALEGVHIFSDGDQLWVHVVVQKDPWEDSDPAE